MFASNMNCNRSHLMRITTTPLESPLRSQQAQPYEETDKTGKGSSSALHTHLRLWPLLFPLKSVYFDHHPPGELIIRLNNIYFSRSQLQFSNPHFTRSQLQLDDLQSSLNSLCLRPLFLTASLLKIKRLTTYFLRLAGWEEFGCGVVENDQCMEIPPPFYKSFLIR